MAVFPKIQNPCPYQGQLSEIMDGDTCRLCNRQVFDLSTLSDIERVGFLKGCADEVCVSYKFPLRPALAAAMTAAVLAAPLPAAAQQAPAVEQEMIIVGGIKDPSSVEYVSDADDAVPELPVVEDDQQPAPVNANAADGDASPSPVAQPAQTD
jgi:hypothetical protein